MAELTDADGDRGARPAGRVAWFNCFAGIAGDMAFASLVDAGAELAEVEAMLRRLPIGGWSLEVTPVLRGGLAATRIEVEVEDDAVVRTYPALLALLEQAALPARVEQRASAAFAALAQVEGRLHRRPPAQVHFHEVGGHDTVVDVVGTMAALEVLGVDTVDASAIATGSGFVRSQHGLLPNPSPAVLGLLAGAPLTGRDIDVELTTPTGAAILVAAGARFGPLPSMRVLATGYGAGTRELPDLPNCTQVVIGEPLTEGAGGGDDTGGQPLLLLEANLDDVTGELVADTVEAALTGGAQDAWVTPVLMKKGRPGYVVSVLADPALVASLRAVLSAESGSFGVRVTRVGRFAAPRRFDEVDLGAGRVRVKVSPGRAKIEHDDARALARAEGVPVREVIARAEEAWRRQSTPLPDDAD